MTKLDFPDTPSTGQQFGSSGTVWRWDGTRWGSTAGAAGARGAVAYAQVTADQVGITGTGGADLSGLTVTFNVVAGRRYKISGEAHIRGNADGEVASLFIADSTGTALHNSTVFLSSLAWPEKVNISYSFVASTGGPVTYKLRAAPSVTTWVLVSVASPTAPAFILAEDITYEAGSSGQPGPGVGGPTGTVAYAQASGSQGGIVGTLVDITGLSVNFTADPNRRYKTTVMVTPSSTVANDDCVAQITDAAGNQKQGYSSPYLDPNSSTSMQFSLIETGLSGLITRKVRMRGQGAGTVTNYSAPTQPAFILVEDITYDPGIYGPSGPQPIEIVGGLFNTNVVAHREIGTQYKMEIETGSIVCDVASGWGSFLFNRLFSVPPIVIIMNGDYGVGQYFFSHRSFATNGYAFVCTDAAGGARNGPVRVNYIAIAPTG